MLKWREWFERAVRCERCGFRLKIVQAPRRARFFVDPDRWAQRCKAQDGAKGVPFECPHLRAAAGFPPRDASA